MVVGKIITLGGVIAGFVTFGLFAQRATQVGLGPAATEIAESIGTLGQGLGSLGGGVAALGVGFGGGISGLFKPFTDLFTFFQGVFGGGGFQATAQQTAAVPATQQDTEQLSTGTGSTFSSSGLSARTILAITGKGAL